MNLESIAEKLELTPTLALTRGQNLFVHAWPASAPVGVLLRDDFGGTPIDNYLPGYIRAGFMVIARSSDYPSAHALAKAVSDALTLTNVQLPGMDVRHILPRIQPVVFPNSAGSVWEFLVAFDACYVEI
jgi:hypothetical protein